MADLSQKNKGSVRDLLYQDSLFQHIWSYLTSLPPDVRNILLASSTGRKYLLEVYNNLMSYAASNRNIMKIANDFLLTAWETDPVDPEIGIKILRSEDSEFNVSNHLKQLIKAVILYWDKPIFDVSDFETLLADYPDLVKYISSFFPPLSLAWWKYLKIYAPFYGAFDWFEKLVRFIPWQYSLHIVQKRILLDIAIIKGDYSLAHQILSSEILLSKATKLAYLGKLAFLQGYQEKTINMWLKSIVVRPWNINLILRTYDVLKGIREEKIYPAGKIVICFYSYNKCNELNKAIGALVESDIRDSKIIVLINGSTDGSFEMVCAWQERLGKDKMEVIFTPVNIGAPAARNWLMHHPIVKSSDWIVYLDDDAIVPKDWLYRFGTAISLYPDAGVYGCKIVDAVSPYVIQCVDNHLQKPPEFKHSSGSEFYCQIVGHYGELDMGDFDYIRPCAQVSGCCHIFNVKTLFECGDFDLRFSPSQHDDLDHNFRSILMKKLPVYTGHLVVKHMNITGKEQNKAQRGSERGNRVKLYFKHMGKPFRDMFHLEMKILWEDLIKKIKFISDYLSQHNHLIERGN